MARAADELLEGEPDAALREVKERHRLEAAREVDAERGGRVGRAVRADDHLVLAPEAVQEGEQALGVVDHDRLLVEDRYADGERGQPPVPFPATSARRSPAYLAQGVPA